MAKLTDLAYTKAELKERNSPKECATMPGGSKYPWGLTLNLDEAALKKLGIKSLPKVGSKLNLVAKVQVTSAGSNESVDRKPERSLTLQLTDAALDSSPRSAVEAVDEALEK